MHGIYIYILRFCLICIVNGLRILIYYINIYTHRAEQVSKASRDRKLGTGATTSGNKPDVRVKLFFEANVDERKQRKNLQQKDMQTLRE